MSNVESTKSASFAIANVFHADHGVERSTMQMLVEAIKPSGFFLHTQELPVDHADLVSALRGPLEGDAPVGESEVFYASRGGEGRGLSRMIALPKRRTRMVTIIGMATSARGASSLPPAARPNSSVQWWHRPTETSSASRVATNT